MEEAMIIWETKQIAKFAWAHVRGNPTFKHNNWKELDFKIVLYYICRPFIYYLNIFHKSRIIPPSLKLISFPFWAFLVCICFAVISILILKTM